MKEEFVVKFEIDGISISVMMNGFWQDENKVDSSMHEHTAYEFHTIMRGSALLETDNETISLEENDSVLIPPEIFHRFKKQEKGSAILSFTFFMDKCGKSRSYETIMDNLRNTERAVAFLKNEEIKEKLRGIVANIYSEHIFSTDCIRAQFVLLFAEIFAKLTSVSDSTDAGTNDATENDARIFMIEEYFNEFYMERISLQKLSKLLYLSEKQTERIIKKAFGTGFRQKLSKLRIMNAKKLLTDSELEVREIAEACGYSSYNGFYLAFKEKTGMTPIEYRKKISNQ